LSPKVTCVRFGTLMRGKIIVVENFRRPRLLGLIALSLGMTLALGACGGDNNSSSPQPAPAVTATPTPATPTATPTPNPSVAAACVASGAMGVIVNSTTKDVSVYAPAGDWSEIFTTGVYLVPLEGSVSRATIPTTEIVNSCSGDSITGTVICSADNNDVYLINGSTLTKTVTSIATGTANFSGGNCTNCNSSVDPLGVGVVGLTRQPAISPGAPNLPVSIFRAFQRSLSGIGWCARTVGIAGDRTEQTLDPVCHGDQGLRHREV